MLMATFAFAYLVLPGKKTSLLGPAFCKNRNLVGITLTQK